VILQSGGWPTEEPLTLKKKKKKNKEAERGGRDREVKERKKITKF